MKATIHRPTHSRKRGDRMYVKLIQPRMHKRPMDTDIKIHMSPPLGLLTVANLLRGAHRVVLENENIQEISFDDRPDVVGISVTLDVLPRAIEIARRFRQKGCKVVAGGIHITTASETIPENAFDVLCIGQAEGTWPEIMRDMERGTLQKIYRCRPLMPEELVSPAYDMLTTAPYLYCNIVHTSRGCPYRCDYCYNSSCAHQYINRRIEDVLADIRALKTRHILFIDDNFTGNPAWTREFLRAIRPMKLKWSAAASINVANDSDLLDLMRECGCTSLFIGFESVNPDAIRGVHKKQNTLIQYEQAVREIHRRGIMINGSFVFGLDGDTQATFRATLDWIVKNKIETVTSHILTPYPGTVLHRRMTDDHRITCEDLSKYNTAHVVFQPKGMSADELYDGYLWIYRKVYSFANILRRTPLDRQRITAYLLFNFLYRKYGKATDWLCKRVSYERIGRLAQRIMHYHR